MSDLKITHAGTVQTQTRQGPMNPFAPFGQVGSVWSNSTSATPVRAPLNQVFIAITIVEDATSFATLVAEDPNKYANTAVAAHNNADGGATSVEGELGVQVATGDELPAGLTIYGRWTEFSLNADGTVIAYIG